MSAAMSRRIRAVFGAANFWAIVLYNILALNSLEFALLVTKRLLLTGKMLPALPTEAPLSWVGELRTGTSWWPGYQLVACLFPMRLIIVQKVQEAVS